MFNHIIQLHKHFYDFFKENLNFNYENQSDYKKIINIICDNSNKIHFERLISEIMSEYKNQIEYKENELVNVKIFSFKKIIFLPMIQSILTQN